MLCIKRFIIKKYTGSKKTQRRVNAALLLAHFIQDHCRKDFRRVHFKINMTLARRYLVRKILHRLRLRRPMKPFLGKLKEEP